MKRIVNLISLRSGIAVALCFSFMIYPLQRFSPATAATAHSVADLKSESQYRSEASRYDGAIRAISSITTMKLETADDLKRALEILRREGPNLKFRFSRFVVLALSDATFASAVKKKMPNKQAAEVFLKDLNANRTAVLKLDGAESLKARMQRSIESDAATLRRAAERLQEAAGRIKKASQARKEAGFGAGSELKLIRVGFDLEKQSGTTSDNEIVSFQDPVTLVIGSILLAIFVATVLYAIALPIALTIVDLFVIEEPDEFARCQQEADDDYKTCISEAEALPFPLNLAAMAVCGAAWLRDQATCALAT